MNKKFTRSFVISVCSIAVIFALTLITDVVAQQAVQITRHTDSKKIIIKEGQRVIYKLKDESRGHKGILETVSDSSLTIDHNVIPLSNFDFFGRKRKGSGFWSFFTMTVGVGMVLDVALASNHDPCPSCIDAGTSGEGWTPVQVGLGLGLIALSANTTIRYSARDL
jgi:hypothetical protein